jgi:hypothetical protein
MTSKEIIALIKLRKHLCNAHTKGADAPVIIQELESILTEIANISLKRKKINRITPQ